MQSALNPASVNVDIVDPAFRTPEPYPSIMHGGRLCVAVPAGRKFAVESRVRGDASPTGRYMYVVAVDGRDTLTNQDASARADGLVSGRYYMCKGIRTSDKGVREFVCTELGQGATTGERNGTASSSGLVAVAVYGEQAPRPVYRHPVTRSGGGMAPTSMRGDDSFNTLSATPTGVTRSAVMGATRGGEVMASTGSDAMLPVVHAGPSAGAAAGAFVADAVGETTFARGELVGQVVVEYDTPEGWAARGVSFEPVQPFGRNPWPADARRFADESTL